MSPELPSLCERPGASSMPFTFVAVRREPSGGTEESIEHRPAGLRRTATKSIPKARKLAALGDSRRFLIPAGFTLVEILVVITIIGVLAGLLVPAVMRALNSAQEGTYKLEVDTLAEAIEKYHNKYGDYPPDGSNWPVMERHLRKAFPQILQSELNLLDPTMFAAQGWNGNPWTADTSAGVVAGIRNDFDQTVVTPTYAAADLKVMDPAEALVFFLGGFSSNPQRPFTGDGGPFIATGLTAGQTLQYNVSRNNSMFEFKTNRLTLVQEPVGGTLANISSDEEEYLNSAVARDLLPVYLGRADLSRAAPFVYFDSRTYVFLKGSNNLYANFYQRTPTIGSLTGPGVNFGAIRPLVSNIARTPVPVRNPSPSTAAEFLAWFRSNLFLEDKKFQVIGPGLDDIYGGFMAQELGSSLPDRLAAYWTMPSGNSYIPGSAPSSPDVVVTRLLLPINLKGQPTYERSRGIADNAASCTEGRTLMTSLTAP